MPVTVPESFKIVDGTQGPVTTNGGIECDYVSLKNAHRVTVIVNMTQAVGHATSITLEKATAVDGTGSVAITTAVPIWLNGDVAASDTLVRQTDAVSQAVAADIAKKMVVFQVDPVTLGDGFDCLVAKLSDSSQGTNFAQVTYLLETRYGQATPPAAITD